MRALALPILFALACTHLPAAHASDFAVGDVFAGIGLGRYQRFSSNGVSIEFLNGQLGGETSGCFCDANNNLYTTNFTLNRLMRFDHAHPHPITLDIPTPGVMFGVDRSNESVLMDAAGTILVGHAQSSTTTGGDVHRYTSTGTLVGEWATQGDSFGSDWIDSAADQCTLFYASEGRLVKRYDICLNLQLLDFAIVPGGGRNYALRLLPPGDGTGGLLVANGVDVKRLDGAGAVVQTYDVPGFDVWFALTLDPNGTSFWSGDIGNNQFCRFNIASGAVEVGPIPIGGTRFLGLCVCGERTAGQTNLPPTCAAGGPYLGACRSANVGGASATDLDGDALDYTWSSSRSDVTVAPASGTIPPSGIAPRMVPAAIATYSGTVPPCGVSATLTLMVTDTANATSTCSALVTFDDNVSPSLSATPVDTTVACDAVLPPPAVPTASDDCDPLPTVTFNETRANGSCPQSYTLTRTWTATDACGNATTRTQSIAVRDTAAPVLHNLPSGATVECDAVPPPSTSVTASDNCDPAPAVTFLETRANGSCPQSYTLNRTWTARDACGTAASATQTIVVRDTTRPALHNVPASATVECDAVPPPSPAVNASDNCDPAPTVTFAETRVNGSCPDSYTLTRTWTARDACGNTVSGTQALVVRDTAPPVLHNVPTSATVECDAVPPPSAAVNASDNCDPAPSLAFAETRVNGSCPGAYVLTRTWVTTDCCGNAASAVQVLTVVDTTPPVVRAGSDDLYCLWPPNHKYVCFTRADFESSVVLTDACSLPASYVFAGCTSDQCDDAPCREHPGENGDGSTTEDCVVSPGGDGFCVRSERAGTEPAGRHYAVSITATDACGNTSSPPTVVGRVHVPHDQGGPGGGGCRKP